MDTIPNELYQIINSYVKPATQEQTKKYYQKVMETITIKHLLCVPMNNVLLHYLMSRFINDNKPKFLLLDDNLRDEMYYIEEDDEDHKELFLIQVEFEFYDYTQEKSRLRPVLEPLYNKINPNTFEKCKYMDAHRLERLGAYDMFVHDKVETYNNDLYGHIQFHVDFDQRLDLFVSVLITDYVMDNLDKFYNQFLELMKPFESEVIQNLLGYTEDVEECGIEWISNSFTDEYTKVNEEFKYIYDNDHDEHEVIHVGNPEQ